MWVLRTFWPDWNLDELDFDDTEMISVSSHSNSANFDESGQRVLKTRQHP